MFEDNVLVRAALEEPDDGRVLLVAGGGSIRCALFGGDLGPLAVENGWAGVVVVDGRIRDHRELRELPIGVNALGACPRKSQRAGLGERDVTVEVAGVEAFLGD